VLPKGDRHALDPKAEPEKEHRGPNVSEARGKEQPRVEGTIALGVMFFGLMHVLGIEGPIFSGDDETELAPR
jgi:hypothetical protein